MENMLYFVKIYSLFFDQSLPTESSWRTLSSNSRHLNNPLDICVFLFFLADNDHMWTTLGKTDPHPYSKSHFSSPETEYVKNPFG